MTRLKPYIVLCLLAGLALALGALCVNTALLKGNTAYVVSIKRVSVLFTVLYGALWFKEKQVAQRVFGSVVVIAGAVILAMS